MKLISEWSGHILPERFDRISGRGYARMDAFRSGKAHVAQSVERVLGKDEVSSSILLVGSRQVCTRQDRPVTLCRMETNG